MKLTLVAILLMFARVTDASILLSDDFSGTMIDPAKWSVFNDVSGGTMSQDDKIFWNRAGTALEGTGHGLITNQVFQNGGIYTIEGDYQIETHGDSPGDRSIGESSLGINFTPVAAQRGTTHYGNPLNSIKVTLKHLIMWQGHTWDSGIDITTKSLTGGARDLFDYYDSTFLHLKTELDTDNLTVKLWVNGSSETHLEATIPEGIWLSVIGAGGEFRVEEFRSWSGPTDYFEHRLDNYQISHTAVPTPPTLLLLGFSLACLVSHRRARTK